MAVARVKGQLLGQCDADAKGHAPQTLRPRRLGVQDPPGSKGAMHPPHPRLARSGMHRDLGEIGPECGLPHRLRSIAGLDVTHFGNLIPVQDIAQAAGLVVKGCHPVF